MQETAGGIRINYEKYGTGDPFLLLHGNGESLEIFDKLVPILAAKYTVYAIDSRNHGNSQKGLPLSYDLMADDVKNFIEALSLKSPRIFGFSDGGITALILASKYPSILKDLTVAGANAFPKGLKKSFLIRTKIEYFLTKNPLLALMLTEPDVTEKELSKITVPVLFLAGSRDLVRKKHTLYLASKVKTSRLKILPGETHSGYVVHSPKLADII